MPSDNHHLRAGRMRGEGKLPAMTASSPSFKIAATRLISAVVFYLTGGRGMHQRDCALANKFDRTIIIGNTASGKSWLSKNLGAKLSLNVVDLDQIRWIEGDYSRKETKSTAIEKTVREAENDQWIIEGVYGWLVIPIIERATCLIWIDIPWSESRKNLLARETARGPSGNFAELETWSSNYWERSSASSYKAHFQLYNEFLGPKYRLANMKESSAFVAGLERV